MKRASAAVLLAAAVVGVAAASSPAGMHSRLTRAQAVKRLHRALHARPTQVQFVEANAGLKRVVLAWTAYSPDARIPPTSWPMGAPPPKTYHGPARAWIAADGGPPTGAAKLRPRHHLGPRLKYIAVSLVRAIERRTRLMIKLAPLRPEPRVGEQQALRKLTSALARLHATPSRLWLVLTRRRSHGPGGNHTVLHWMAVGRGTSGPLVGLLNATSGERMLVRTFHR
jgi:hypothetical protein